MLSHFDNELDAVQNQPIPKICEHAHTSGSWIHVDGAFGLWARVLPSMRKTCDGIEMADSWSLDAHKTLNVPYDSGIILCRHREALMSAFRASASYFQWSEHRDSMNFRPSMSARARVIELWAVFKTFRSLSNLAAPIAEKFPRALTGHVNGPAETKQPPPSGGDH